MSIAKLEETISKRKGKTWTVILLSRNIFTRVFAKYCVVMRNGFFLHCHLNIFLEYFEYHTDDSTRAQVEPYNSSDRARFESTLKVVAQKRGKG